MGNVLVAWTQDSDFASAAVTAYSTRKVATYDSRKHSYYSFDFVLSISTERICLDALLAKLTNLSYEFFGILLPGAAAILALTFLWIASGELLPVVTTGALPDLSLESAIERAVWLMDQSAVIATVAIVSLAYFFGYALTWIARGGKSYDEVDLTTHLKDTLTFRPPKRNAPYDPELQNLFESAGKTLFGRNAPPSWSEFYPVAKMYLMQKAAYSLVATYQNKYTLHRAIAATAAIVVWGCLVIIGVSAAAYSVDHPLRPSWLGVAALLVFALVAIWVFSSSYLYYWRLWGNYMITETYTVLRDESKDEPVTT